MKRLTRNKRNIYVPSWNRIALLCLFSLQIIKTVSTQSTKENIIIEENVRQIRVLETPEAQTDSASDSCPMCNLSEMPMELAEKINEISDVDIFIQDFVDTTNSLSNVSSTFTHPANRKRRAAASNQLRQATCQPVDTVISLVPKDERDPTIYYFPSCVIVKQCGGCCAHSGTSCTPTDETEKQITVKKTKFVNEPKLANLGDVTITIKEHNKCKCQCKKSASDCNGLQRFIRSQCRCECTNSKEADQCAQITDTTDEDEYSIQFGEHSYTLINETFEATDDSKYETDESQTTTSA
ncbi:uncharacterized protein [Chironomus tepperi]|uniref:uncharacterized protein isoform X2 n=1 Tax=Chironomus tepperi TaxID=113505 RepID=UPI00391FB89B